MVPLLTTWRTSPFSKFDRALLGYSRRYRYRYRTSYALFVRVVPNHFASGAIQLIKSYLLIRCPFGSETTDLNQLIHMAKRMDCQKAPKMNYAII